MVHHPVLLGIKLALLIVFVIVLAALYDVLTAEQFVAAVIIAGALFVVLVILLWAVVLKRLDQPDSKLGRHFIHNTPSRSEDGYIAPPGELTSLVGQRGTAASMLRPSGVGRFGDRRVPVVTEGEFVGEDAPIEVVAVKGSRVVVRPAVQPDKPGEN
jgi:membrane-bound serine protease (ClpP class)